MAITTQMMELYILQNHHRLQLPQESCRLRQRNAGQPIAFRQPEWYQRMARELKEIVMFPLGKTRVAE